MLIAPIYNLFDNRPILTISSKGMLFKNGLFKEWTEIKETLNGIFHHIFVEGNFTHYIAYVKGENTIVDRLKYYPDYKQQRTKEIPEKWEFTKQYAIEKWGVIPINNIEVDDAVRQVTLTTQNEMGIVKLPTGAWANLRASVFTGVAAKAKQNLNEQ